MANCIVPDCSCNHYEQTSHDKGKILAYRPDCNGCGHKKILHRLPTTTDTLILKELMIADSVPCCSLIPMSELSTSTHFDSYDLIPIPPDEIDSSSCKPSQVLCLCKGYSSNKASILQQFSHTTLSDIQHSLPSVQCTNCKHPLLTHQKSHPSHYLVNQKLLSLKKTVCIKGTILPSSKLINFVKGSGENCVAMVTLVRCNSSYKLIAQERIFNQTVTGIKRRRSERRRTELGGGEEREEKDLFTQDLVNFVSTSLEASTAFTLSSEEPSIDPTCLSSFWLKSDSTPQLLVAIGTAHNQIIIHNMAQLQKGHHQILNTINSVTVLHYCTKSDGLPLLCAGDCTGNIQCWKIKGDGFHEEYAPLISSNNSPITVILRIPDKDYIVIGNERGEIYLYQLANDQSCNHSTDKEHRLVLCQKFQLCSSSCTVLYWMNDKRCLLVGSADNNIHVLLMTSSFDKNSILNYFSPVSTDRFHSCAIMRGHQSFISGITPYRNNILSIGWDGYIMLWSYDDIQRTLEWKGGEEIAELDPCLIYKLGTQEYLIHVPIGVWNIFDRELIIGYQSSNKELSLSIY